MFFNQSLRRTPMTSSATDASVLLPNGLTVFERGWLSSNNILILGDSSTALVDTGYCTHQDQTLELVKAKLNGKALDVIVNTHLHSDHCGGNAILQKHFPLSITHIPEPYADAVANWDEKRLSFATTGQLCYPFQFNQVLVAGQEIQLGDLNWQVHAAPGHDPDSVILFEPQSRCLISADALWQHGFGVVFPELVNTPAFELVGQTLDLIEKLNPVVVIPGHGQVFSDVADALTRARERLAVFQKFPIKHTSHAAKVLLKFKLMELKKISLDEFVDWAIQTQLIQTIIEQTTEVKKPSELVNDFLAQLSKANVIKLEDSFIYDVV